MNRTLNTTWRMPFGWDYAPDCSMDWEQNENLTTAEAEWLNDTWERLWVEWYTGIVVREIERHWGPEFSVCGDEVVGPDDGPDSELSLQDILDGIAPYSDEDLFEKFAVVAETAAHKALASVGATDDTD